MKSIYKAMMKTVRQRMENVQDDDDDNDNDTDAQPTESTKKRINPRKEHFRISVFLC